MFEPDKPLRYIGKKESRVNRERIKAGSGKNQLPAQDDTRCENLEISFV